jgi:hypothetical protein
MDIKESELLSSLNRKCFLLETKVAELEKQLATKEAQLIECQRCYKKLDIDFKNEVIEKSNLFKDLSNAKADVRADILSKLPKENDLHGTDDIQAHNFKQGYNNAIALCVKAVKGEGV